MAVPDFICRGCYWRSDHGKVKCRRAVKQVLVCNTKSMYREVSARSAGGLSKDGTECRYFEDKKKP